LIIRKIVSAIAACLLVMLIYFIIEQSGFVIALGMYLLPILLFYGLLASIFSDFVTKNLKGLLRGGVALLIHLFLATLFNLIPFLFSELEWKHLFSEIRILLSSENFFFIISILSSSLFWCIDEILRSQIAKDLRIKIDNLKIY
jgi:hypothetical protein